MSDSPDPDDPRDPEQTPDRDDLHEQALPSDPDAPGTYLDDEHAPAVAEPNEPA